MKLNIPATTTTSKLARVLKDLFLKVFLHVITKIARLRLESGVFIVHTFVRSGKPHFYLKGLTQFYVER